MKRLVGGLILAMGFATAVNAQSVNDPNGLLQLSLNGLVTNPDQPRDFETVVFWIIYGSPADSEPFMVNDFNLTVESDDDAIDALAF